MNCLTISSVIGNLFTFSLWNFLGLLNSPTLHIALFHLHAKLLALLSLGEDFIIPSDEERDIKGGSESTDAGRVTPAAVLSRRGL